VAAAVAAVAVCKDFSQYNLMAFIALSEVIMAGLFYCLINNLFFYLLLGQAYPW